MASRGEGGAGRGSGGPAAAGKRPPPGGWRGGKPPVRLPRPRERAPGPCGSARRRGGRGAAGGVRRGPWVEAVGPATPASSAGAPRGLRGLSGFGAARPSRLRLRGAAGSGRAAGRGLAASPCSAGPAPRRDGSGSRGELRVVGTLQSGNCWCQLCQNLVQ